MAWHQSTNDYVINVDNKFVQIDEYVRGEGGMEDQIRAAITDQITATNTLRTDATAAITSVRTDATAAITGLASRVSAIEQELTRPVTGILARLAKLEALGLK
jgi:hypothetical protein